MLKQKHKTKKVAFQLNVEGCNMKYIIRSTNPALAKLIVCRCTVKESAEFVLAALNAYDPA